MPALSDPGRLAIGLLAAMMLAAAAPTANAVTFGKVAYCTWKAREPGAVYDRVSISQGDHLMIHINDRVFQSWGNSDGNTIELSTNHARKRVRIRGAWTTVVPKRASLGAYLYADARRSLGGARSIQIWRRGKMIVDIRVANTPSTAQLNACVPLDRPHDEAEEQ